MKHDLWNCPGIVDQEGASQVRGEDQLLAAEIEEACGRVCFLQEKYPCLTLDTQFKIMLKIGYICVAFDV